MILSKSSSQFRALVALSLFLIMGKTYAQTFLSGTTVVGIRTPTEIIVGADSKMVAIGDNLSDAGQTCKIIQVGPHFRSGFPPAALTISEMCYTGLRETRRVVRMLCM